MSPIVTEADSERLWASARTLTDVGQLTARWLDGELPGCFVQDAPPDDETADIPGGILASLNRAGYVTECSQPGHDWTPGWEMTEWRQRAGVMLLCDQVHAAVLAVALLADVDLIVAVHRPRRFRTRWGCFRNEVPVTEACRSDPGETCWFGRPTPRRHWKWMGRLNGNRRMGRILAGAWQVTVVDPVWGRNDRLWDAIARLPHVRAMAAA